MISKIDAHTHFWDPSVIDYPWLKEYPDINKALLPHDFIKDIKNTNIVGCVFIQSDALTSQSKAELDFIASLAKSNPFIKGIVAAAPIEKGFAAKPFLEEIKDISLVKGIRRLLQSESAGFSLKDDFLLGIKILEELNLPFDICINNNEQFTSIIKLVQMGEKNIFILDHCGKPNIANNKIEVWKKNIDELAKSENCYCKLSGLLTEMASNQNINSLEPYLETILFAFGAKRILYGGIGL